MEQTDYKDPKKVLIRYCPYGQAHCKGQDCMFWEDTIGCLLRTRALLDGLTDLK